MPAEERAGGTQYPFTAWNFVVITLDAAFFFAGLAFIDPMVVLPILVDKIAGSQVLVGLMSAIQRAGWIIPQLLATSFVLHHRRKKPFVMWPVVLSRLPFIGLAVAFCLPGAGAHVKALLLLLIGIYTVFFFGDGLVGVPWHDIIARTIPPKLRGRFFGSINFFGGVLIIIAGQIVKRVLADPSLPFPENYGRLFIFLCVCMALSTFSLALMKEPKGSALEERQSFLRIVRSIPSVLRQYRPLRRVIIAENIMGVTGLALPFYALYAHKRLHVPDPYGGMFIQVGIVGLMAASVLWAFLNDRHGPRTVLRGVAFLGLGTPVAALAIPSLLRAFGAQEHMPHAYSLVFLLSNAAGSGVWMGVTNYVFEIAPDEIRPLFLGLSQTLAAPIVLMPLFGGVLLRFIPYEVLFIIVGVGALASAIYISTLERPLRLEHHGEFIITAPGAVPREV
ncbi:MAG: MFS transporter [Armatimonadota bacterium]